MWFSRCICAAEPTKVNTSQKDPFYTSIKNLKSFANKPFEDLRGSCFTAKSPNHYQPCNLAHFPPPPPPTPTHPRKTTPSSKKNRIIPHLLTPNPLHLPHTTTTQKIKPHTILLRLNQLTEPASTLVPSTLEENV